MLLPGVSYSICRDRGRGHAGVDRRPASYVFLIFLLRNKPFKKSQGPGKIINQSIIGT